VAVCALLLCGSLHAGQTAGTSIWLDRPLSNWNKAGQDIPPPPDGKEALKDVIGRCGLKPPRSTPGERALDAAGWIPFWNVDRQLLRDEVEIVGGMREADGMCEPVTYNLFVFVRGRFAGVLSPQPMTSRLDGSSSAVRMPLPAITAEFARYKDGDAFCCPSSRMTVQYRVDTTGDGPVVVPVEARTTRGK
jgi:LppP/LprE lipoprotein